MSTTAAKKIKEAKKDDKISTPSPVTTTDKTPVDASKSPIPGKKEKGGILGKISFRPFWMKKQDSSNTLGFDLSGEISSPFDFQHKGHVDYDEETGLTGFNEMLDPEAAKDQPLVETVFVKQKDENEIVYDSSIDTTGYTDTDVEQPLYLVDFISTKDPKRVYGPLTKIGSGSTGLVYRAMSIKENVKTAIKIIELKPDTRLELFENEIRMMSKVSATYHPNICQYYGCYTTENEIWIAMEFLPGGCLTDLLPLGLNEVQIASILKEELKALKFVHAINIIHRDIKSDNLLLSADGEIKLADFGFTAELTKQKPLRKSVVGTPYWMAPEVAKGQLYDISCDIWSTGVMALEMAEGVVPRLNLEPIRALFVIAHEPPPELSEPENWSEEFHSFLDCCLQKDPKMRKTAQELLEHPFIQKAIDLDGFLIDLVKQAKTVKKAKKKTLSQIMREMEEEEGEDGEEGGGGEEDDFI